MPDGYSVRITESARRELESLPGSVIARMVAALRVLGDDPRPRGCRKLVGSKADYRLRVGDYRAIYVVDDVERSVLVSRIRHRSAAY